MARKVDPDALLAAALVGLLGQASPDRLRFGEVAPWLQSWKRFSSYLIAPRTDDPTVRSAAVHLRAAGRRLVAVLQPARRGKLRTSEAEDLIHDFPEAHARALAAADALLAAVT